MAQKYPRTVAVLGLALLAGLGWLCLGNPEALDSGKPAGTSLISRRVFGASCIFLAISLVAGMLVRKLSSGPRPSLGEFDGERATVLRHGWPTYVANRVGVLGGGAFIASFATLLLFGGFPPVLVAVAGVFALGVVSYVVPVALGRHGPGAIYLRPSGILDRHRGVEAAVRWDDVVAIEYGAGPVTVRTRHNAPVTSRRLVRIWTHTPRHRRYALAIGMEGVGIDARTLAHVLHHYAATKFDRHQLGTAQSLSTVTTLQSTPGADAGTLVVGNEPELPTPPVRPRYPQATVHATKDEADDPSQLLERAQDALSNAGATEAELDEFWTEAIGDDDRHMLATTRAWVNLVVE